MRAGCVSVLLLGLSCSAGEPARPTRAAVPPGAVGAVGAVALTPSLLASLEGEPSAVLAAVSRDLLLAQAQSGRSAGARRAIERGLLGRSLFETLAKESQDASPVLPEEWAAARARLWLEVDRPRAVRAADAFVPVAQFTADADAFALAQRIHAALTAEKPIGLDVEEFVRRVGTVEPGPLSVRLMQRPAMAADGRVVPLQPIDEQAEPLEPDVARALAKLEMSGDLSPVVGGRDGFHVLLCIDVVPEQRVPEVDLKTRLLPAVLAARLAPELALLTQRLRQGTQVEVASHHTTLTRLVWRQQ